LATTPSGLVPHANPASRIIFALDFATIAEATAAAQNLGERVGMVKIGLELFVAGGPEAVKIGAAVGLPVFLDLKLHDIPETVERAINRAAAFNCRLITVHASGGSEMLRRAVREAEASRTELQVAAVTVLTSLDSPDLATLGVSGGVSDHASRLARVAFDQGVRNFVCSPHEVSMMREILGKDVTLITPGVRLSDRQKDDQKRIATPARAVREGADFVVIGRPIRDATNPLSAAEEFAREIAHGLTERA
jgi:orotidine-5'-phosphate decarboxylase